MSTFTDEELAAAREAFRVHGSKQAAADAVGVSRHAMRRMLTREAERGMLGYEPVVPGFVIKSIASKQGDAWVRQAREPGAEFAVPDGHSVKGVSALVDAEGREVLKWVKTREAGSGGMSEAIHAALDARLCPYPLPPAPDYLNADTMTIYPIVDLHLGLFSWGKETGTDYDLDIASGLLKRSVATLVSRSANSETAVILDLGDYVHTDSSRNQTARSSNPLDVDSRYAKVCRVGVELAVHCIELALQKHDRVIYRKLPGNHDDETSLLLSVALSAWFRNEPRVTVDTDPGRFFMKKFGKVMVAATHGDMLRMGDMAGFMAANWPKAWGDTEFRFAYTGHVHHDRVKSGAGVRAESFNTLAAKDAWHAASGYTAARTAVSITMHRDFGEIDRLTVSLPMLTAPVAANDNNPQQRSAA